MNLGGAHAVVVSLDIVFVHCGAPEKASIMQVNGVELFQPHPDKCLGPLKEPLDRDAAIVAIVAVATYTAAAAIRIYLSFVR